MTPSGTSPGAGRRAPLKADLRSAVTLRLRAAGCVYAEEEAALLLSVEGSDAEVAALVDRRVSGEPLEHLLGWVEFCGRRMAVGPGVFVPRRRTELLVDQACAIAAPGAVVLDLCCGCGAVGAAIAGAVPGVELHVADVDVDALRYASRNVAPHGGHVHLGDLYDALPATLLGRVDTLVVNAPYVPTDALGQMPAEARVHEPRRALDGGADGLEVHRRVARGALSWLAPAGSLLIETSRHQASGTADALTAAGLVARVVTSRALDATVVVGRRP